MEKERLTYRIDADVVQAFRERCETEHARPQDVLADMLRRYVAGETMPQMAKPMPPAIPKTESETMIDALTLMQERFGTVSLTLAKPSAKMALTPSPIQYLEPTGQLTRKSILIEDEIWTQTKAAALIDRRTISQCLTTAIRTWLASRTADTESR